ncbi:S8 family peptidase [Massilia sp. W12]|uniref:S8 family peptidase n=1 Tax=Massilia sp. W12 TaxID=3126507 RepID=UPI0030D26E48
MKLRATSLAAMLLLSGALMTAHASDIRRPYVVQLADKPVASYTGEIRGLAATKPAAGQSLDINAADVQNYINYLNQKQGAVLAVIGNAPIVHDYKVVLNGFTAMLTDAEVRALKKTAGVAAITPDQPRELLTNYTPGFLGLDKSNGVWTRLGGQGAAGENIIIGIVDSGVWPENTSFADRVDANGFATHDPAGAQVYGAPPASWKGSCEVGEGFALSNCNNKLIGAQKFDKTYRSLVANGTYTPHWIDYNSPRDNGGHGTHTASTAGGNGKVNASAAGIAMGAMSGIAPRARLAMYKVCWSYQDPANPANPKNSCFSGDSVAAIEKAVKDGVNVINFSISGSQDKFNDPVEVAFLNASNAGVFVAASAGNSGPANQVAHISPWLTTVGASTHDRLNAANAILGNNASYQGASMNTVALGQTPVILSTEAAAAGADASKANLCYGAADGAVVLDPAKVAGKIVVCTRGVTARVNKSQAVKDAGGVGMIMIDNGAGLVAEAHAVPTVHVPAANGAAIRAYVAGNAAATAEITKFSATKGTALAPVMAGFSSRGPNKGNGNILKPDLTAPGVDILAAYVPDVTQAERDAIANGAAGATEAAFLQGTSMSSPHVAGLGALLKQLNPTWSPAAIKSALMTTGSMTFNDGLAGMQNGQLPWSQGAGHVVPNLAADPGLVYDAGAVDYARFLCGLGGGGIYSPAVCQQVGSIASYNLNLPSLTAASVMGKLTFTRTVTNVSNAASTYQASASLPGYNVVVNPSSLTLAPGEKKSFTVSLTRTTAPADTWAYGELVWNDGVRKVRSPLSAKPTMIAALAEVSSEAATGNALYTIGTGFNGSFSTIKGGLKEATRTEATIGKNNDADGGLAACKAGGGAGVNVTEVAIPSGALTARFALFDADTSGRAAGSADDLDLVVLNSAGATVGTSGGATSNEVVTLSNPAAGNYKVCVIGYAPNNDSATYTMSSWVVNPTDVGGNLRVLVPGNATIGGTGTVAASWSGLTVGKRYLGAVQYVVGGVKQSTTLLSVDTTDAIPQTDLVRNTNAIKN